MGVGVLSSMSGFPTWDPGIRARISQSIWLLKPVRLDDRNPTGLRNRNSFLGGHTQGLVCTGTQGKAVTK